MIPSYSKKRTKKNKVYFDVKAEQLAEHPECQVNCTEGCLRVADQIEHTEGNIGDNLTDKSKMLSSCGICSRYITDNPGAARALGISRSRLAKKQ